MQHWFPMCRFQLMCHTLKLVCTSFVQLISRVSWVIWISNDDTTSFKAYSVSKPSLRQWVEIGWFNKVEKVAMFEKCGFRRYKCSKLSVGPLANSL